MYGEDVAAARAGDVARDDGIQPLALGHLTGSLRVERPVGDLHPAHHPLARRSARGVTVPGDAFTVSELQAHVRDHLEAAFGDWKEGSPPVTNVPRPVRSRSSSTRRTRVSAS